MGKKNTEIYFLIWELYVGMLSSTHLYRLFAAFILSLECKRVDSEAPRLTGHFMYFDFTSSVLEQP